jgi:GNAT superfamily N-acetyltransferase
MDSPFHDASALLAAWCDPNLVQGEEVLVPLELQGRGIGTMLVRSVEERARAAGKQAVTAGTSRNAEGVAWKSLPWWQHLGYRVTHEEENPWTRSIGPGVREIRMRKDLPPE